MNDQSNEAAIRTRAYELWEMSNRTPGKHEEHWHQAERELHGSAQGNGTDTASQHSDAVSELPAQDGEPKIVHLVP